MTAGTKTVTVMVIHPNFKTVTVTVIFGEIFKNNKTAGTNFDSNGKFFQNSLKILNVYFWGTSVYFWG